MAEAKSRLGSSRKLSDLLFILWAGGAALLSYSLVYALRKPFTAATFEGLEAFGLDYKVLVTIIQIMGYLIAKFAGIKLISELKRENRLKFILISVAVAELSPIICSPCFSTDCPWDACGESFSVSSKDAGLRTSWPAFWVSALSSVRERQNQSGCLS